MLVGTITLWVTKIHGGEDIQYVPATNILHDKWQRWNALRGFVCLILCGGCIEIGSKI